MPGSARRVRTAYSRTLCLPCLRQVYCASNTTATEATMSSESFLPISDDVCRPRKRFYALFSKSPKKAAWFYWREARCFSAGKDGYFVPEGFSGQLTWATAPHTPDRVDLEVFRCRFPTLASNRHTGANRAEFEISPQKRVYPSP